MTKAIFNGICDGDWSYETKSKVETSKNKLKDLYGKMRTRKDNLLTVTLKLTVPVLHGGCRFYILNSEKKHFDQKPGSFEYVLFFSPKGSSSSPLPIYRFTALGRIGFAYKGK